MPTQGTERLAKADTHFYASAATPTVAELLTDLSQYAENWTQAGSTNCVYSADDSRFAPTPPRVVCMHVEVDSSPGSRVLFSQGGNPFSDADSNGVVTLSSLARVEARIDTAIVGTVTLPGIAASNREFIVVWTTSENPGGSGATALMSELQVWNLDTGDYEGDQFLHSAFPTPSADRVFFGGYNVTGTLDYEEPFHAARISFGRWHTATESREDWVAQTTAPTSDLEVRTEQLVPTGSNLGDDGMFYGPASLSASSAVRDAKLRQVGPLVNITYEDRPWIEPGFAGVDSDNRLTWNSTTLIRRYLHHAPVPNVVNRIIPRLYIQHDMDTTGSDTGDDETVVTFVCAVRRPTSTQDVEFLYYTATQTLTGDDGSTSTGGAWVEFSEMRIARNDNSETMFFVGIDFNGTATDQRLRIKAMTVDPGIEAESGNEIPEGIGG